MPNSYSSMLRPAMTRTTAMAVKTMMVQHQSGSCTVHRPAPRPRPWPIARLLRQITRVNSCSSGWQGR